MLLLPFVDVDDAVASVDFDDRRDQRDDVSRNELDVRRVVDRRYDRRAPSAPSARPLRSSESSGDVVDRAAVATSGAASLSSIPIVRGSASFASFALFAS
jgi:hypothetical protein